MNNDTQTTKNRYDRIAPFFDVMEGMMEKMLFTDLRKILWQKVNGHHLLEVGVGTGKNFPHYPAAAQITAIDFSEGMLEKAQQKTHNYTFNIDLRLQDVQSLEFADNSFDTIIATFVFCSVPLPLKGLKELHRVCKPGGQVLLLEHVLSDNPVLAKLMNWLNPLVVRIAGANINRKTVTSVKAIGFQKVHVDSVSGGIVKIIEAIK